MWQTKINKLQLRCDHDVIPVKGATFLYFVDVSRFFFEPEDEMVAGKNEPGHFSSKQHMIWYVNNTENGDYWNGTISGEAQYGFRHAYFRSPLQIPPKNPVTIRAELYVNSGKGKGLVLQRAFTHKILIYDEYKVTVQMDWGKGSNIEWADNSSFTLKISDHVEIKDLQNTMAKLVLRGKCKPIFVNETTCTGLINITGIKMAKITPPDPSGRQYSTVTISFDPASAIAPQLNFPPCGGNMASLTLPPVFGSVAYPAKISFELNNERQILSMSRNSVRVEKADPDDITAIVEPVQE